MADLGMSPWDYITAVVDWWFAGIGVVLIVAHFIVRWLGKDFRFEWYVIAALVVLVVAPFFSWRDLHIQLSEARKQSAEAIGVQGVCKTIAMGINGGEYLLVQFEMAAERDAPREKGAWWQAVHDKWLDWQDRTSVELDYYNKEWGDEFGNASPDDGWKLTPEDIQRQIETLSIVAVRAGCE